MRRKSSCNLGEKLYFVDAFDYKGQPVLKEENLKIVKEKIVNGWELKCLDIYWGLEVLKCDWLNEEDRELFETLKLEKERLLKKRKVLEIIKICSFFAGFAFSLPLVLITLRYGGVSLVSGLIVPFAFLGIVYSAFFESRIEESLRATY